MKLALLLVRVGTSRGTSRGFDVEDGPISWSVRWILLNDRVRLLELRIGQRFSVWERDACSKNLDVAQLLARCGQVDGHDDPLEDEVSEVFASTHKVIWSQVC